MAENEQLVTVPAIMTDPKLARLTKAELAVLRLLAQGHDTKSAANALGISIHAINERLRDARLKLEVTSSREAARRLTAHENAGQIFADNFSEDAEPELSDQAGGWHRSRRIALFVGVLIMSTLALATLIWSQAAPVLDAPKVVAVSPARGAVIAEGPFTLSVTFDQPMQANSFSIVQIDPASFPQCNRRPMQSADLRSFSLSCMARAGQKYEIWFNRGRWLNFKSRGGIPAEPYQQRFRAQ